MTWTTYSKYEIAAYLNRRTTPRRAKKYLRLCLSRIETLERANQSFPDAMSGFLEQMPDLLEREIDRRTSAAQLQTATKELKLQLPGAETQTQTEADKDKR